MILSGTLDYDAIRDSYQAKFGVLPPTELIKSVSAMQGTRDLFQSMQEAIGRGQPMDFTAYARAFFADLAERPHGG